MKIIFFDGNCPMCHSWVKRLIHWDKKKQFKFAPLDSETAHQILSPLLPDYIQQDTIVFYDSGHVTIRSDAALNILGELNFPISLLKTGLLMPRPIRDAVYARVAANRFKFGERYESCPLPPVEWRDRFI